MVAILFFIIFAYYKDYIPPTNPADTHKKFTNLLIKYFSTSNVQIKLSILDEIINYLNLELNSINAAGDLSNDILNNSVDVYINNVTQHLLTILLSPENQIIVSRMNRELAQKTHLTLIISKLENIRTIVRKSSEDQTIQYNNNDNNIPFKVYNIKITNYNTYEAFKSKYINNNNIKLDVRFLINKNLDILNNDDTLIYDKDIKINYKVFISLLPTIYYVIFSKQKRNVDIYTYTQTLPNNDEENIPIIQTKRVPRVRFNFEPYYRETTYQTISMPQNVITTNPEKSLCDTLFWDGINIDDFNKFPLYVKTIIMDSCLLLGIQTYESTTRCVIYQDIAYDNTISKICIIPYPYTSSRTMYDVFKQVSNKINANNASPNYNIGNVYRRNIGLNNAGNNIFINRLASSKDVKDLINNYVLLTETHGGNADIILPPNQEMYFAIVLLDLLGFSPTLTKLNTSTGNNFYIQTNRQLSGRNLIALLSVDYKNLAMSRESADYILRILTPIMEYLIYLVNKYKTNPTNISAGSCNSGEEFCIPVDLNPLDRLNKMDISFIDTDNILDIMNKDIFNLDNDVFKHIIVNDNYGGDIVDVIYDNIPQSIYMKTDVIDKIYDKIFAGAYSINDILDTAFTEDNSMEIDSNLTKDLIIKLKKLLNKTNNANLEDNANILKSHILSSINNVFNRYSCSERIPIQYLINIRTLLKQYSNENIPITPEVKEDIKNTITSIYKNTKKIITTITVLSAGIDLVKAYKRANIDISDTVIDENFIKKLCELCKESFYKYNRNNDTVYKNILKDVFNLTNINEYEIDNELC